MGERGGGVLPPPGLGSLNCGHLKDERGSWEDSTTSQRLRGGMPGNQQRSPELRGELNSALGLGPIDLEVVG